MMGRVLKLFLTTFILRSLGLKISRSPQTNPFDTLARNGRSSRGPALAVLLSGQTYRFVYRDMFERFGNVHNFFGCPVDLYIVLSSCRGEQQIPRPIETPYADDVLNDQQGVATFLKQYGFNNVVIDVIPQETVNASAIQLLRDLIEAGGGQAWFQAMKTIKGFDEKFGRNSQMMYLRNKVYSLAKSSESKLPYRYAHFMYMREDNVFQATPQVNFKSVLPKLSMEPAMVVDQLCPFGGIGDKIFFGNRQGMDVLFGKDYFALLENLLYWLKVSSFRNSTKRPMQTEFFTKSVLLDHGVNIVEADFARNDVRYSPQACIPLPYVRCASRNVFQPCNSQGRSAIGAQAVATPIVGIGGTTWSKPGCEIGACGSRGVILFHVSPPLDIGFSG